MSSHSRQNRRQILTGIGALLAAPVLAGCQFKPMYGSASGDVKQVMAEIEIGRIPGRVGQQLRNELIFATTGGGQAPPPRYRLEMAIREWEQAILVETTGDAQGKLYNLEVTFNLVRLQDNKVVFKGKTRSRAAFDKFESIFSNVRARRDAENRAARTVADAVRTQLAAYMSSTA